MKKDLAIRRRPHGEEAGPTPSYKVGRAGRPHSRGLPSPYESRSIWIPACTLDLRPIVRRAELQLPRICGT
jgi:hypothetical protein